MLAWLSVYKPRLRQKIMAADVDMVSSGKQRKGGYRKSQGEIDHKDTPPMMYFRSQPPNTHTHAHTFPTS